MANDHDPTEEARVEATEAAESDLQASSALFVTALERAIELEKIKQKLSPGDRARDDLAREIEAITLDLVSRGRYQTRLIELQAQVIDERPEKRLTSVVLEEWRAAEQRLNEARMELEHASDAADRLRDEHRRSRMREG